MEGIHCIFINQLRYKVGDSKLGLYYCSLSVKEVFMVPFFSQNSRKSSSRLKVSIYGHNIKVIHPRNLNSLCCIFLTVFFDRVALLQSFPRFESTFTSEFRNIRFALSFESVNVSDYASDRVHLVGT